MIDISGTLAEHSMMIVGMLGLLAFLTSVVTEVLKHLPLFRYAPTDLVVVLVAQLLTMTSFLWYMAHTGTDIHWYSIVATVTVGFVVTFIAMYGWEKFEDFWFRHKRGA